MGDLMSGLRALTRAVAQAAPRDTVPVLAWAEVASVSPLRVLLDGDDSHTQLDVAANAVGPVMSGQRVMVARQGKRLTVLAAPAAITALTARVAALESPGPWVACTPAAGFVGTLRVRTRGPGMAEVDCDLTGTIPVGATVLTTAIPAAYRPVGSNARFEAVANGFPIGGYLNSAGSLGVIQQTGASRTGVAMRSIYGL